MYTYSKDGVTVAAMIDTRKANAQGKYPVKIRVNQKRVRQYYPTGKSLTREEWEKLPSERSRDAKCLREEIESSFYLVKDNVSSLLERGEFSFHLLDTRMGKSTGDTLNNAIRSRIKSLEKEERIGTMQTYEETLRQLNEFAGDNISFDMITPQWLKRCETFWLSKGNEKIGGLVCEVSDVCLFLPTPQDTHFQLFIYNRMNCNINFLNR